MRKILALAVVAALAVAAAASTAGAQTASRFTVVDISTSHHPGPNGSTIAPGKLVKPGTRNVVVGRDLVKFTPRPRALRVRVVFFFPNGKIKAKGLLSRTSHRLQIVGGTRGFNGIAGKVRVHSSNGRGTPLTFVLVR
jgi:hypothetical protein